MSEAAGEFDAFDSSAHVVEVGGFRVAPLTVDRLPRFTRAIRPIIPDVAPLIDLPDGADPMVVGELIMELMSENGERLLDAVAIAVADDAKSVEAARERVNKLNPAGFILLALKVVKVNADFFAQRLLPAIQQAAKEAKTLGVGQTPAKP